MSARKRRIVVDGKVREIKLIDCPGCGQDMAESSRLCTVCTTRLSAQPTTFIGSDPRPATAGDFYEMMNEGEPIIVFHHGQLLRVGYPSNMQCHQNAIDVTSFADAQPQYVQGLPSWEFTIRGPV